MKLAYSQRTLVALALYCTVLFNVFACGLCHGEMTGMHLNMLGGSFCSSVDVQSSVSAFHDAGDAMGVWMKNYVCPVCSTVIQTVLLFLGLFWLIRIPFRRPFCPDARGKSPPRYSWPSANPRASPFVIVFSIQLSDR